MTAVVAYKPNFINIVGELVNARSDAVVTLSTEVTVRIDTMCIKFGL